MVLLQRLFDKGLFLSGEPKNWWAESCFLGFLFVIKKKRESWLGVGTPSYELAKVEYKSRIVRGAIL